MKKFILLSLVLATSFLLTACADKNKTETPISPSTEVSTNIEPDKEVMDMGEEKKDTPDEKTDTSTHSMTGDDSHMGASSEEEFIANMIPHHQEAVNTASIIVAKTENMELKEIASNIVSAQKTEIELLNSWMKSWYPGSTKTPSSMKMMRDLSSLSSHDLDDAFMEDMIKHHESAVHMAEEVLEVSQRSEIVKIANGIISSQNAEITKFKELLADH